MTTATTTLSNTEKAHQGTADYRAFSRAPASKPATWHTKPSHEWNFAQRFLQRLDALQDPAHSARPPVHAKTDLVPVLPVWRQHAWILPRVAAPLLVHRAYVELTGAAFHPVFAFFFYWTSLILFLLGHAGVIRRMGKHYGFYDGQHERDGVPDEDAPKVLISIMATLTLRPVLALFYVYDRAEVPAVSWQTPLDVIAYTLVLDFFFYTYHRSMHEVPFLWRFHRLHHTTKHPNLLLSAYADQVQETFDMVIIPGLAYLVVPMDFTTWWIATAYLIYTEASGHCGVRVFWQIPTTFWLRYFGCDLAIEDHDRHHQVGYRSSGDYGKQSRLWDGLFGSMRKRVESHEGNLDHVHPAKIL